MTRARILRLPTLPIRGGGAILVAAAVLLAAGASSSPGATGSTVVGATVPSVTSLDASDCATGTPDVTDFGIVTAGATRITGTDCDVAFGSSNDTAQLRMVQDDRAGVGMWMQTAGQLDPGFDGDGKLLASIGAGDDQIDAIVVQPDGKLVAAGSCWNGSNDDFCLARFSGVDGSLDASFDGPGAPGNGKFLVPIGSGFDYVYAAALQPDGKVVIAGSCSNGSNMDFCFARFSGVDGSLDASFDGPGAPGNGKFLVSVGPGDDEAAALTLQPDGRIVAAGTCSNGSNLDMCVMRLNGSDGSLDASFDGPGVPGNGRFLLPIGAADDDADAVVVQDDGKIVVAGDCDGGTNHDVCLARLGGVDGSLDASFDGPGAPGNGRFLVPIGSGDDDADSVVQLADGKLVTAGECRGGTDDDVCLARFSGVDGSLDASFDGPGAPGNGKFLVPIGAGDDDADGIVVQPDGRLVTAGDCAVGASSDFCFARFDVDGSLDASFDGPSGLGNGKFLVPIGAGADKVESITTKLADGKLVAAGGCRNGANDDFCIVRFDQGGQFDDYVTGGGSDRDFDAADTTSFFGVCLRDATGGASAAWSSSGSCDPTDGATWHAVPTAPTRIAYTTAIEPDPSDAIAHLRFGLRAATTQRPGHYIAPIMFDVLAPDA